MRLNMASAYDLGSICKNCAGESKGEDYRNQIDTSQIKALWDEYTSSSQGEWDCHSSVAIPTIFKRCT